MRFHFFDRYPEAHVRKSLQYLKEAHQALVDHQAAAEHHSALATMYATRIARIEAEMDDSHLPPALVTRPRLETVADEGEFTQTESVVAYLGRAMRR